MNVLKIIKMARYELDSIRTNNVVSAMWGDEEVLQAVNTSMEEAASVLRAADSPYLKRIIRSDGATMDLISEVYDPASLAVVPDQLDYVLPPDCVSIVSIRALGDQFSGVRFRPAKDTQKAFVDQLSIQTSDLGTVEAGDATYWYTRVGDQGLRIVPMPKNDIDVELTYYYRPAKLRYYSTGTVSGTVSLLPVTGSSTLWYSAGLREPAELMLSLASITAVDLSTVYPSVRSIVDDTTLTMKRPNATTFGPVAYFLAMIPTLPQEHHAWLAQMTAACMMRKVSIELSDKMKAELRAQLVSKVQPEVVRDQVQESYAVEPFELPS